MRRVRLAAALAAAAAVTAAAITAVGMKAQQDASAAEKMPQRMISVQPERSTIVRTVYGHGEVQPRSQPGVYALAEGTVCEQCVSVGDAVKKGDPVMILESDALEAEIRTLEYDMLTAQNAVMDVETYDYYRYEYVIGWNGRRRRDAQTGEFLMAQYSNELALEAPADGRVMAVYIREGDDALAVYRRMGSVAVLSTDGRMKVELSAVDHRLLQIGMTVEVTGDGFSTRGTVVSLTRQGTEAVVQIVGDDYPMDSAVSVRTLSGEAVGEGVLEINKPMYVSSYGGTVRNVAVEVGDMVERGQRIARYVFEDRPLYLENATSVKDYIKAKTAYDGAVMEREELIVRAPCDGVVASVDAAQGESVTSGMRVASIVEPSGMTVRVSVDELDVVHLRAGQPAALTFDALEGVSLEGTVEKIAPLGHTDTSVTTYDVYIGVGAMDERILGGMNVSAQIEVDRAQDALTIPTDALVREDGAYCVLMEDGSLRSVTTGIITDERTQILGGLDPSETILYPG